MATGWTIKSWDRERGRGVIVSDQLGDLAFDGAVALVDDFRRGELVEIELEQRAALAQIPDCLDFRVVSLERDLVVQGDDDAFAYGHRVQIRFRDVEYLDLPMRWDGKAFALASEVERRYLAGRDEMLGTTAAVKVVDAARRIFFVTCADVETTLKAG